MSDSVEDRLREAVKADGRALSVIGKEAGVSPASMTRFMTGGGLGFVHGTNLATIVGMPIGPQAVVHSDSENGMPDVSIPKTEPNLCHCGCEIVPKTECRDCRLARKRATPGTGLAVLRPDVTRVTSKAAPSVTPLAASRPRLTDYEKKRNAELGMWVEP